MTTKEKMHELVRSLDHMTSNFNLDDLNRALSSAKDIEDEIASMEAQIADLQKAA